MAELFGVTPAELRATARQLDEVGSDMKGVLASLLDNLDAVGAAWGDDEMGEQFAKQYRAQLDWVGGSVDAKTGLLEYYAQQLKGTADSHERNDQ